MQPTPPQRNAVSLVRIMVRILNVMMDSTDATHTAAKERGKLGSYNGANIERYDGFH